MSSGSPGAGVGATHSEGNVRTSVFTFDGVSIPVTDDGANGGHANLAFFNFPKGLTQIFGGRTSLALVGGAGLTATSAVVAACGTAPAAIDNATLTLTEADIVPSTACTLTANAATFAAVTATAPALFDGSTTAKVAYLNFATPDAGVTAATTMTVTGTIRLTWQVT